MTDSSYWLTATEIVHNLFALDSELNQTYEVLDHVRTAIQHGDWANHNATFWNMAGRSKEMANMSELL